MTSIALALIRAGERLNWYALRILALVTRWRYRNWKPLPVTFEDLGRFGKGR
jgi:hypothetical protein